jgi:hypothetical protein
MSVGRTIAYERPDDESASSASAFPLKYGKTEEGDAFETLSWTTRRTPAACADSRRSSVLATASSNVTLPRGERIQ